MTMKNRLSSIWKPLAQTGKWASRRQRAPTQILYSWIRRDSSKLSTSEALTTNRNMLLRDESNISWRRRGWRRDDCMNLKRRLLATLWKVSSGIMCARNGRKCSSIETSCLGGRPFASGSWESGFYIVYWGAFITILGLCSFKKRRLKNNLLRI